MRKFTLLFLFFGAIILKGCGQSPQEEGVRIIAHRGYWKTEGSAQNSIASLKKAQALDIFGTEFDAQLTADSVYVAFHDSKIHGVPVEEMTYAQMLADTTLANGERISTVDEYLKEAAKDKSCKIIFELKPQEKPGFEELSVEKAISLVKKHRLEKCTEFISFSIEICKMLVQKMPGIPVSYLGSTLSPAELHELGITGVDFNFSVFQKNPDWVPEAHALGMSVNVWTVDKKETALEMIDLGVDYITTNYPETLLAEEE
ncbi:MAG: glycerophosphodiester phosphodiesterase [Bacteroidales bacterium]|nr:glycerophosphodiester phosphodiesterase [Bacteroidales bacterium]